MKPLVCAICLTADRQAYTDRAVRCWLSQDYRPTQLLILDSGREPYRRPELSPEDAGRLHVYRCPPATIGALRNQAIEIAEFADIIVHWDSDEWSAPDRITHQLKLLADAPLGIAGYSSALVWDSRKQEAWLYDSDDASYVLGTSLVYWRKAWELKRFPDLQKGEDSAWLRGKRPAREAAGNHMVVEIHEGNTSTRIEDHDCWVRLKAQDERLKDLMRL